MTAGPPIRRRRHGRAAVALFLALAVSSVPARGAEPVCPVAAVFANYERAVAAARDGAWDGAQALLRPLAEAGFPPAQRRLAEQLAAGRGGAAADRAQALFWAAVAARAGDLDAVRLADGLAAGQGLEARSKADARAASWRARLPACARPAVGETRQIEPRRWRIDGLETTIPGSLSEAAEKVVADRLPKLLAEVRRQGAAAVLLLPLVERIEFIASDRYDRYIGWKPGADEGVLQMATGNLVDTGPGFVARAIALEVMRRAYGRLSDGSRFVDPFVIIHREKRIFGSVYDDVDNRPFFEAIGRALDMAAALPPELARLVGVIDEIRYNPLSKHFSKSGPVDGAVAYYNRRVSGAGRRIVFIRRDTHWSSDVLLMLSLVHEGTHAAQDARAEAALGGAEKGRRALAALEAQGKGGSAEARALARAVGADADYARRWYKGRPGGEGERTIVQDIAFECEALVNEIRAARAVGAPISAVDQSQYLPLCDDAKVLIVRWRDDNLLRR